jgi:hypothetical protein
VTAPVQAPLDFSPRPLPPVVDQRVPKEERRRLSGMSLAIHDRLRQGAATNVQLAAMFRPGAAWRTRVSDLRLYLEQHGETVRTASLGSGLFSYWIEAL